MVVKVVVVEVVVSADFVDKDKEIGFVIVIVIVMSLEE